MNHVATYNTEAEALAFVAGVEYVNDSAIEHITIKRRTASLDWAVYTDDTDS